MPYDFLVGNKSRLSPNPFRGDNNYQESVKKEDRVTYQESLRNKLSMDPKAMFTSGPAKVGLSQYIEPSREFYNFPSVTIGDQVWMAENLDITVTYNGINISNIYDVPTPESNAIDALTQQYFENASANNDPNNGLVWSWREFDYQGLGYGKWYSYKVVRNLMVNPPLGWRVPTESDFDKLINYLGGNSVAGGYLKGPDTANKWNPTGYNYISYDFPFNAVPSGLSTLEDAAFMFIYYYSNIPEVQVNTSPLEIGDFGGSKASAFWCATNDNTNAASFYYIDWRYNNFFKTTFADYFSINPINFNSSMMPIRLIRDF